MSNFHGYNRKRNFFEGWYFKQQSEEESIAFIPGISVGNDGNKFSFIQVITSNESFSFKYPYSEFKAADHKLNIDIGKNRFSKEGIDIDIDREGISIKAKLVYGGFTTLDYDIMGPFSKIPLMECHHGIVSMHHSVNGYVTINEERMVFKDGIGYIEEDWGRSFPKNYLWVQCNNFKGSKSSVMAAVADIPFAGFRFKGCIAVVYHNGMEYRLATYNGVKIVKADGESVVLTKGNKRLEIDIDGKSGIRLMAPCNGFMTRCIREHPKCSGTFRFYIDGRLEFTLKSDKCSFEYVREGRHHLVNQNKK